jgi:ADP-heptose:LPS heptosyltransferase
MAARLLVLRALGLGDFLTGVPAYRGLRRAYPAAEIVLAAPEALRPLVPLTGALDRLLPTAELRPVRWTGPPPELAVNLHGRGPDSHRLLLPLGARRLVGFARADLPDFAGPAWRAAEHEVLRWCRLLAEVGVPCDPADLRLAPPRTRAPTCGAVVLHPGAAAPARRWPLGRFAAVARALARDGRQVVVTGGPAERGLATELAEAAGLPPTAVLAGRTDLGGLAAVVAGATLVICGDTGVAHLATAFGTPSVLLFGPTSPAEWGPLRDLDRHAVLWAGLPGDPHGDRPDPGLVQIGVADVLAAADRVAARTG